jgi:Protein of unknown function DUF262
MRSFVSIQRIHFQSHNRPILDTLRTLEREDDEAFRLNLNPSYQRESVWTMEQRVNLIKSMLQGLPIGSIFLNQRSEVAGPVVVDGKQRLETLLMWLHDEVEVPMEWFPDDMLAGSCGGLVGWSDLTPAAKRHLANRWVVATYETSLPTEAQEAELYKRVNYGGTPHEPLAHA